MFLFKFAGGLFILSLAVSLGVAVVAVTLGLISLWIENIIFGGKDVE